MIRRKDLKLEKLFFEFRDLRELLRYSAKKYGKATAFVTKLQESKAKGTVYKETSYEELLNEMNYLGTALSVRGYNGSRFALIGENSYNWCLSYFTVACGLGVIVPLDKLMQQEEMYRCIKISKSQVLLYDKKQKEAVISTLKAKKKPVQLAIALDYEPTEEQSMEELSHVEFVSFDQLLEEGYEQLRLGERKYIDAYIDPDVMTYLLFTSGTTSESKAVMLSHRNLMSCNYAMSCEEELFPDDVNLIILPLHHCYGMSGLLAFLSHGLKNTFCDGLKYVAKNLREYNITIILCVPLLLEAMYKKIQKSIRDKGLEAKVKKAMSICNKTDKLGINLRRKLFKPVLDAIGGNLRTIICGAAALDPEVAQGMNNFGILTLQGYGLTETSPTISSESYKNIRYGSVGKLMPNFEGKILEPNEDGIGELAVRGDSVMLGYYENKEATDAVLKDGWFKTGDYAYFDKDGYLYICGRKKNVIVMKNGKNIFPEEIENHLNRLPYVEESMVFSKDKASDLVLCAKLVYSEEYLNDAKLSLDELQALAEKDIDKINKTTPSYKMIKKFFLSNRPTVKTSTRKTKRNEELAEIAKELEERNISL